ncbi:hypothetical protein V493_00582 [Pseudogymnoascus sp. VKM F-4281 (FW-2241)]|nr:hypothetical protein V493_00582 [Pseudogymnoascus sp. VKM F-4281 (FW-2241)]
MPVKSSVTPQNSAVLRSKIESIATKPSQEGLNIIFAEIKAHLGQSGYATYEQTKEDTRAVALAAKCIVFLISGAFEVGGEKIDQDGLGHLVEDEVSLRLQQNTVVVIINTN